MDLGWALSDQTGYVSVGVSSTNALPAGAMKGMLSSIYKAVECSHRFP